MKYRYGTGNDEVHEFFQTKRSWSRVKDRIVGDYIDCYLKTVHRLHRPIVIVDGFAGPGRFGDDSDGSPLIICKAISNRIAGDAYAKCIFSDTHPGHRKALERNLEIYIRNGVAEAPYFDCAQALDRALALGTSSTIFFYLDPYGIKDLEFDVVRQIYERDVQRSTEVLINFNFRAFMRMSGNWNYGDSASEVERKVKQAKIETVDKVMGGDYWLSIVTDATLTKIEREDAIVAAYLAQLKQFFQYAFAIPVKERGQRDHGIPDDELAHYHLVFATRSSRAVEYMNDVALNALEPYFRQFNDGLLFDFTPERYQRVDRSIAKAAIIEAVRDRPLLRPDIYETVIPRFFLHYRKKDYRAMIDELAFAEQRLFADERTMRRTNKLNDKTLLSSKPWRS